MTTDTQVAIAGGGPAQLDIDHSIEIHQTGSLHMSASEHQWHLFHNHAANNAELMAGRSLRIFETASNYFFACHL